MSKAFSCLMLSVLGLTTACVDNSYDLSKDIDMTITVGGDLVTPGSSSENITLNDLFDIDYESSDLDTLENGDFILSVSGDPSSSSVKVNEVNIDPSYARENSNVITFVKRLLTNGESAPAAVEDLNPVWNLTNNQVPEDIVDLEYADEISSNRVNLTLKVQGVAKGVWLKKGLNFTFPAYMVLEPAEQSVAELFDLERNNVQTKLVLRKDVYLPSSGTTWKLKLSKVYFKSTDQVSIPSGQGFIPATAEAKAKVFFQVPVPVNGNITVKENDFPSGRESMECSLVSELSSNEMTLERVRAKVNPEIDFSVSDVLLNNLPDFLTDNDVNADLNNPQILLRINNEAEVEVNLQAQFESYKNAVKMRSVKVGTALGVVNDETIILQPKTENLICLSPINTNVPDGFTWVKCESLPELIQNVPERVKVENVEAQVLPNFYTVKVGVTKNVYTDYDMKALLEFGKDFAIVYKDTLNDWEEDIKDFKVKEVEVNFNAKNCIPLNLDVTAAAIDVEGHEMPEVLVTIEGYVTAGSMEAPTNNALKIFLKHKDGKRIENLDGVILRLDGKAVREGNADNWTSKTLNAGQVLKLENLKLGVKGGVTLDLN